MSSDLYYATTNGGIKLCKPALMGTVAAVVMSHATTMPVYVRRKHTRFVARFRGTEYSVFDDMGNQLDAARIQSLCPWADQFRSIVSEPLARAVGEPTTQEATHP